MYAFLEQARKSVLVVQKNVCRVEKMASLHTQTVYRDQDMRDDAQRKREKEKATA